MGIEEIRARACALTAPISDAEPLGSDIRRSELAIDLKSEVQKLDALAGEAVDWGRVAELGVAVTKTVGKDIVALSYTSLALYQQEGLRGALVGLLALTELARDSWEGIFPPWPRRKAARQKAFIWLGKQLSARFHTGDADGVEPSVAELLVETIEALNKATFEKAGVSEPLLGGCVRAAKELQARILAAEDAPEEAEGVEPKPPEMQPEVKQPKPVKQPPKPVEVSRPKPPAPKMPSTPKSDGDVEKFLRDTFRVLIRAANDVRNQNPEDPRSYWLIRFGIWAKLPSGPPIAKDGATSIRPLDPGVKSSLEKMVAHQKWRAALDLSESSLVDNRYAFDLHRHSADALGQLGDKFEAAQQVIYCELASLLRRVPSLELAKASDGSPLANDETRSWIREVVIATPAAVDVPAHTFIAPPVRDATQDVFAGARQLLTAGEREAAIQAAQEITNLAHTPRARFQRRLELAYLCLEAGMRPVACAIFQVLEQESRTRELHDWEPQLVARCLQGLLMSSPGQRDETLQQRYAQLCVLNPVAGAGLIPKG